jgi:transcriptional regulator with XRE-family HTH domain
MPSNLKKLHTRLIDAVSYEKQNGTLSVRFDDGDLATATLEALKVPSKSIARVAVDEFRRGIEIHFRDRSTHDISADYFTWLTQPDYAAAYPADASLGPRVGANIVSLRKQRGLSQAALASAARMAAPNLSRLESGRHVPTLDILLRLSKALGVSLPTLIRPTSSETSLSRLPTKRRVTGEAKTSASRTARQPPRARSR